MVSKNQNPANLDQVENDKYELPFLEDEKIRKPKGKKIKKMRANFDR